jgi:SagB-type dehydrogenase family enzyme
MRNGLDFIDARRMGQTFATDRDLTLPVRPRLIPELIALPIGEDGVMFVGAEEPQVFRGRSARRLLLRLLPLLDGEHTVDQIAERQPAFRPSDLHDMVSLLFSRGLLEDGRPQEPVPESLVDVASFIGRHIDASRCHSSRTAVLQHLTAATVSVVGPKPLAELLAAELRTSGVGSVRIQDGAPIPSTLTIVLSTGATSDIAARFEPDASAKTLLIRLGHNEAHIGPLLIDGVTACPTCVARVHPHPDGEPDVHQATLWIGLASLYAFLALSQLPPSLTLRGFRVQRVEDGALIEETRLAVRLPGCTQCGIAGEPWAPDDPRMLAWIYHCATSLSTRAMLSPKDHQAHYLVEHARLASEERRLIWSTLSKPLPESNATAIATHPVHKAMPKDSEGKLHIAELSSLLARTAGEIVKDGHRRRLVPTGGNLGSVNLWVIARTVTGLAPGAYLYDARRHTLDFVRSVDDDALRHALCTSEPLPDCLLVGAGALAKCAQKYRAFAYRLIHLDAGVALAFAHLAASALGLELREYADFHLTLPRIFGIPNRWEFPLPTFAIGISPSAFAAEGGTISHSAQATPLPLVGSADYSFDVLPRLLDVASAPPPYPTVWQPAARRSVPAAWAHRLEALDRILLARQAVREFVSAPIATDILEHVTTSARDALTRRLAAGAPSCFVRPVLAVAVATDALPAGVYEADSATGNMHRRGDFSPSLSEECSNQRTLAAAPVTLFMIGDLRSALTERGGRGYFELAHYAGAAIGEAWLRATSLGLVGTAAGGVIAGGLRRAAGMDGFHECPLLAFHFGRPLARSVS